MPPDPTIFGIKIANIVASAIGGLLSSLIQPEASLIGRFMSGFAGFVVAIYCTPIASPLVQRWMGQDFNQSALEGATGFALGLTGKNLCQAAIRWVQLWRGPLK